MEVEYARESQSSSEGEEVLERSVKKFKDSSGEKAFTQPHLIGDIPGAYAQAFHFDRENEEEEASDTEVEELSKEMVEVSLSKETKARIRAPWSKALIVKVYGRIVGFNYLPFKINTLWNPRAKMDCVDLGKDYFSIKFIDKEDYDKVL